MRIPRSIGGWMAVSLVVTVVGVACGARSELDLPLERPDEPDAGVDAAEDVAADVVEDVPEDVVDEVMPECLPEVTWIYVVTSPENNLYAFKPQTNSFQAKGSLDCPAGAADPFSMAVARDGTAHVVYSDGFIYRVSVFDTTQCDVAPYQAQGINQPFFQFGMGYAADPGGGETLYVADISFVAPSVGLASIDTDTYELSFIGPFSENPGNALELTPTGGTGPLFGYFLNDLEPGGTLVQIDTDTAEIVESTKLSAGNASNSLAVAWWGGAFYIFTGAAGTTQVTRYDPTTQTSSVVATLGEHVVGAGVSTCAPDFPD